MPKYLLQTSVTPEGLKGLLKEGVAKRREVIEQAIKSLGGTLEALYYAFGDVDVFILVDLPDNVSVTALSLVANASGTVVNKTTVLLTLEEVDQATKMTVDWRPPGQ